MAVDNRQQPQLSSMGYEHMRYPQQQPHFTNPWVSTGASQQQLYQTTVAPNVDAQRPTSIAIPYHGLPVTAPPMGQDLMSRYPTGYTTSGSPPNQTYAPTSAPYSQVEYGNTERSPYAYQQDASRRSSHPMNTQQPRNSFSDALDASRGMVSLTSQTLPQGISMALKELAAARPIHTVSPQHTRHTRQSRQAAMALTDTTVVMAL
jgi:hypothetical protein